MRRKGLTTKNDNSSNNYDEVDLEIGFLELYNWMKMMMMMVETQQRTWNSRQEKLTWGLSVSNARKRNSIVGSGWFCDGDRIRWKSDRLN